LGGISGELSSITVTRRRCPDNEQKNPDAQFAPKNGTAVGDAHRRIEIREGAIAQGY
jgi:hypothetical protein